jgi:2'-5' RNA ligase
VRLFTAVVPPPDVLDHLQEWLSDHAAGTDGALRWTPRSRWHVTLGFFGDDDLDGRTAWLRLRLAGRTAPRLRLAGGGTFPGVLWAGVHTDDDGESLARLAEAAGASERDAGGQQFRPQRFQPHLTLARWHDARSGDRHGDPIGGRIGGRIDQAAQATVLHGYTGEWFRPDSVLLMRSDRVNRGLDYTPVERFALAGD